MQTETAPSKGLVARLGRVSVFKRLGPGLITGAADDDPSGIATYSQAGAQFGVNILWTLVLTYPLMAAIQSISARIGRVTGHGLATNMTRVFPRPVVGGLVALVFIANTVNIGLFNRQNPLRGICADRMAPSLVRRSTKILKWKPSKN